MVLIKFFCHLFLVSLFTLTIFISPCHGSISMIRRFSSLVPRKSNNAIVRFLPEIPSDLKYSPHFKKGLLAEFIERNDKIALDFYIDGIKKEDCPHCMLALAFYYMEGRNIYKCDARILFFIMEARKLKNPFIDYVSQLSPYEASLLRKKILSIMH